MEECLVGVSKGEDSAVCNFAVGRDIVKSTKLVKFGLLKLSVTAGKLQL